MSQQKTVFSAIINDIATDYRVQKTCDFLVQQDFFVEVYCREIPNSFTINKQYKIKKTKHWINNNFLFYAEYNIRLFLYLLFKKYDYIIANDLDTLPACFFASKLKKCELVYDSHELFSEGPELQGRSFVQGFWRKLEDFFLPKIKNAYTVSSSIVDFYNDKYQNQMGLIRNMPFLNRDIQEKEVSFPTKNKVVLYQGVLNPGRGIKPMIKALHFLNDVDLVIIGYGKVEQELKDFMFEQKMEDRVHFMGRVPNNVLPNYTKIADVGMVLEEPLGKSFEFSLPNKLFDYIHAELPIVSGDLIEINSIVNTYKVGLAVGNYEPKNIAKAVNDLLTNQELRQEIINNQKEAKKVLCWEREQQKLHQYFSN